jgi:cell division protein FtsA
MGNYITAIDFGSSKIAVAVGERTSAGIKIVWYDEAPVQGIRSGEIRNDLRVVETLKSLIRTAEDKCGEPVDSAVIGISGGFIKSKEISSRCTRKDYDKYITEEEIRKLSGEQFAKGIGQDETIFEVIPQRFNVDDQIGLRMKEVIGMRGGSLEGFFKVFYGKESLYLRRKKILGECGIAVKKAVLAPVASATAVLTTQEMENGVALVDIGKGLTEIAIVKDNIVRDLAFIPFAGDSRTNDIKQVTNLTYDWSEQVKKGYGSCLEEYAPENKLLVLRGEDNVEEGTVELSLLSRIVEARVSEIFDAVSYTIAQSGYEGKLPSGIVITGGSCYLEHLLPLAKVLLGSKVRLAAPRSSITADSAVAALDANASTAVGLVIEAADARLSYAKDNREGQPRVQPRVTETPKSGRQQERGGFLGGLGGLFSGSETEPAPVDDNPLDDELARAKTEERRRQREEEEQRKAAEKARKEEEKKRKEEARKAKEEEREKNRDNGGLFGNFFGGLFTEGNDNA